MWRSMTATHLCVSALPVKSLFLGRGEVTIAGSGSGESTAKVSGTAWEAGQKRSDMGYPLRPNTHGRTMGFWASSTTVVLS